MFQAAAQAFEQGVLDHAADQAGGREHQAHQTRAQGPCGFGKSQGGAEQAGFAEDFGAADQFWAEGFGGIGEAAGVVGIIDHRQQVQGGGGVGGGVQAAEVGQGVGQRQEGFGADRGASDRRATRTAGRLAQLTPVRAALTAISTKRGERRPILRASLARLAPALTTPDGATRGEDGGGGPQAHDREGEVDLVDLVAAGIGDACAGDACDVADGRQGDGGLADHHFGEAALRGIIGAGGAGGDGGVSAVIILARGLHGGVQGRGDRDFALVGEIDQRIERQPVARFFGQAVGDMGGEGFGGGGGGQHPLGGGGDLVFRRFNKRGEQRIRGDAGGGEGGSGKRACQNQQDQAGDAAPHQRRSMRDGRRQGRMLSCRMRSPVPAYPRQAGSFRPDASGSCR